MPPEHRLGDEVLVFFDHDGLRLELVATAEIDPRIPAPSAQIPARFAIRGFHGTTLALTDAAPTAHLLTASMGYELVAQSGHRTRYAPAQQLTGTNAPGGYVDLLTDPALPRGINGGGTVHHVAFRVPDDAAQQAARTRLLEAGSQVSPVIDRAYFKSIYYREPGGVLFEIATDPPGFAVDEPVETLGSRLSLPPRLEPHRAEIEASLPRIN